MNEWFRSPAGWYVLGFGGQLIFSSRFLLQWAASERARRVVIPEMFWVLSLAGGIALFLYAIHKRDPVFALGQASGLIVYSRNLALHRQSQLV
jgi:lipid-A-disaccharide synthase-like uncharacterized protein